MADDQLRDTRVAILADPQLRDYKVVGGLDTFANRSSWPNFFSRLVARLQWNPTAIDLTPDARAWPELPAERRDRLMTLLAGFCVGEGAVSEQIAPFADAARQATLASQESLMAWVFFLQRRDEERHAKFFDRIAAELLGLPGATPAERRAAAREYAPAGVLDLFEVRLPGVSAELAAGDTGLAEGISLYHMLLEGVVFDAGQYALLDDLADGALPGVREGIERIQADERWHVGFGLRCFIETQPSQALIDGLVVRAQEAAAAWGDAVPDVAQPARRARTRAASSDPERLPSPHAADRTPTMSAPVARTAGRSSARRAPASATCRPAAWASATSDVSSSGGSQSRSPRPSLTAVSSRQTPTPAARATRGRSSGASGLCAVRRAS